HRGPARQRLAALPPPSLDSDRRSDLFGSVYDERAFGRRQARRQAVPRIVARRLVPAFHPGRLLGLRARRPPGHTRERKVPRPFIRLRGVSPELKNQSWESHTLLRIGRSRHVEITLEDSSVSRRHAEIDLTEAGWVVRDSGATNGTFLNGVRVGRSDH